MANKAWMEALDSTLRDDQSLIDNVMVILELILSVVPKGTKRIEINALLKKNHICDFMFNSKITWISK